VQQHKTPKKDTKRRKKVAKQHDGVRKPQQLPNQQRCSSTKQQIKTQNAAKSSKKARFYKEIYRKHRSSTQNTRVLHKMPLQSTKVILRALEPHQCTA
jgi:hypothetical protein